LRALLYRLALWCVVGCLLSETDCAESEEGDRNQDSGKHKLKAILGVGDTILVLSQSDVVPHREKLSDGKEKVQKHHDRY